MTPFAPLFLAAVLTPSQADIPLQWKLKKGDVFYAKAENEVKQTFEVAGRKMNQTIDQKTYHKYEVLAAGKDGFEVKQTVLKSDQKGDLPGIAEAADKLKGVTLTYTLNAKFEVTKLVGYDKFLDALVGENEEARKQVSAVLSEETLKLGVHELFGVVPLKKTAVGDTWKRDTKMSMGPLGDFAMKVNYKYAETAEKGGDKVTWKADATYSAPKAGGDGPFTITKGELKSEKLEGEYRFDSKAGRLVSSVTSGKFAGKLTISVKGNEAEIEFDQSLTAKVTLSDKNLADD